MYLAVRRLPLQAGTGPQGRARRRRNRGRRPGGVGCSAAQTVSPHEHRWAATPKGLVRSHTPWGWRSGCTCGWVQDDGGVLGTKKDAYRAWWAHRAESAKQLPEYSPGEVMGARAAGQAVGGSQPLCHVAGFAPMRSAQPRLSIAHLAVL